MTESFSSERPPSSHVTRNGRSRAAAPSCNACGSLDVRPSKKASLGTRLNARFDRHLYTCRGCRARFYASDTGRPLSRRKSEESAFGRRWRRRFRRYTKGRIRTRIIQMLIFTAMLAIFLWVLHFLSRYRPEADGTANSQLKMNRCCVL